LSVVPVPAHTAFPKQCVRPFVRGPYILLPLAPPTLPISQCHVIMLPLPPGRDCKDTNVQSTEQYLPHSPYVQANHQPLPNNCSSPQAIAGTAPLPLAQSNDAIVCSVPHGQLSLSNVQSPPPTVR